MNSRLLEKAAPFLAFRVIPTTLLALITYLSIFIALVVTDTLPNVPQNQGGLNIKQAYEDLRQVCSNGSLILHWNLNCGRLRLILILISLIRTMPFGLISYPDSRRWRTSTHMCTSPMTLLAMLLGRFPRLGSISREQIFWSKSTEQTVPPVVSCSQHTTTQ